MIRQNSNKIEVSTGTHASPAGPRSDNACPTPDTAADAARSANYT